MATKKPGPKPKATPPNRDPSRPRILETNPELEPFLTPMPPAPRGGKRNMSRGSIKAQLQSAIYKLQGQLDELEGRPGMYKPEYDARATDMALMGLTNMEIAERLKVEPASIEHWSATIPSFASALYEGREGADEKVVAAVFNAAKGYKHPDVHVSSYQGTVTLTPVTKHYPPQEGAYRMWLHNRQSDRWKLPGSNADVATTAADIARAAQEAIAAALATTPPEGEAS